jgi:hypothetical protein
VEGGAAMMVSFRREVGADYLARFQDPNWHQEPVGRHEMGTFDCLLPDIATVYVKRFCKCGRQLDRGQRKWCRICGDAAILKMKGGRDAQTE